MEVTTWQHLKHRRKQQQSTTVRTSQALLAVSGKNRLNCSRHTVKARARQATPFYVNLFWTASRRATQKNNQNRRNKLTSPASHAILFKNLQRELQLSKEQEEPDRRQGHGSTTDAMSEDWPLSDLEGGHFFFSVTLCGGFPLKLYFPLFVYIAVCF
jgi:hypothetical protein